MVIDHADRFGLAQLTSCVVALDAALRRLTVC